MCAEVIRAVEQFLYREARLLDERRFHDWLDLFTDDLRYWMPVRTSRYPKGSRAIVILDEDRYIEEELAHLTHSSPHYEYRGRGREHGR